VLGTACGEGKGRQLNPLKGVGFAPTGLWEGEKGMGSQLALQIFSLYLDSFCFGNFAEPIQLAELSFCAVNQGLRG